MAPVMTIAGPSAASRVSAPTSTPRPPKNSPTMTRTVSDAGMPFFANRAMVPLKPDPPHQPSTFCAPCAKKITPSASRMITGL